MRDDVVAVLGNLVIDRIITSQGGVRHTIGGGSVYAPLALSHIGASPVPVGLVGADFPDELLRPLRSRDISLNQVARCPGPSTSYELQYGSGGQRELRLVSEGPRFSLQSLPDELLRARVLHVTPVAGEMSPEVLLRLVTLDPLLLGVDLHVLRQFDERGRLVISLRNDLDDFLTRCHVIKGSFEEVLTMAGFEPCDYDRMQTAVRRLSRKAAGLILATDGPQGALLGRHGSLWHVPAYTVRQEVDATGAGDVFLATFLYFYGICRTDLLEASRLASAAASFVVEGMGPAVFGTLSAVHKRARDITPVPLDRA